MCQGCKSLFSYSLWDKRYRENLEVKWQDDKKDDTSKTFNFGLLRKSDCKSDNHVEWVYVHSERWGSELRQETGSADHSENSDPGACLLSSWCVGFLVKEEIEFLKFCFRNDNGNCIITRTHTEKKLIVLTTSMYWYIIGENSEFLCSIYTQCANFYYT